MALMNAKRKGGALLDAEARIGELLKDSITAGNPSIVTTGEQLNELGFNVRQANRFEQLNAHRELRSYD